MCIPSLQTISELPELRILKLSNNRLLEYPQDLKNSFSLQKLEEIDLSGNDIRSVSLQIINCNKFENSHNGGFSAACKKNTAANFHNQGNYQRFTTNCT